MLGEVADYYRSRNESILFLSLLAALSCAVYLLRFSIPPGARIVFIAWTPRLADALEIWSVGIAGICSALLAGGSLGRIGFVIAPLKFFILAFFIPICFWLIVYLPVWVTGLGTFKGNQALVSCLIPAAAHVPTALFFATGEEIGWRGVLTPNLARLLNPVSAGACTGVIWAAWHYVDILYFDYGTHTFVIYSILCFSVFVITIALFLTWLRLSSGSIWPAVLFHAISNTMIYRIFDRSTEPNLATSYIGTEFGIGTAIVGMLLGLISWRLLRRLGVRILPLDVHSIS